jgi:hypothetical protein
MVFSKNVYKNVKNPCNNFSEFFLPSLRLMKNNFRMFSVFHVIIILDDSKWLWINVATKKLILVPQKIHYKYSVIKNDCLRWQY